MARTETWKRNYDEDHVGFMTVDVDDRNQVLCSYEFIEAMLRSVGMTKVEVTSDGA